MQFVPRRKDQDAAVYDQLSRGTNIYSRVLGVINQSYYFQTGITSNKSNIKTLRRYMYKYIKLKRTFVGRCKFIKNFVG